MLFISKVENEDRLPPKKRLEKLAKFLNTPINDLMVLWLADKIRGIIEDEEIGRKALLKVINDLGK